MANLISIRSERVLRRIASAPHLPKVSSAVFVTHLQNSQVPAGPPVVSAAATSSSIEDAQPDVNVCGLLARTTLNHACTWSMC